MGNGTLSGEARFERAMENFVVRFGEALGGEAQAKARFRELVRAKAILVDGKFLREVDDQAATRTVS